MTIRLDFSPSVASLRYGITSTPTTISQVSLRSTFCTVSYHLGMQFEGSGKTGFGHECALDNKLRCRPSVLPTRCTQQYVNKPADIGNGDIVVRHAWN